MKLIKCYVASFGKLENFEYEFTDGLNSIQQENGFGKTTLATFIKAMFYGLEGGAKKSITENERKKYKPWNSWGNFGGYLIFEHSGRHFKIERFFGDKEKNDTAILTDLETGKTQVDVFNLGRRIFEIDDNGFLSTTYLSQKDFEIQSNATITAKFNALNDVQGDDNFEKMLSKLKTTANKYQYQGNRGYIPDEKRALFACQTSLKDIEQSEKVLEDLKIKEKTLSEEVETIATNVSNLTKQIEDSARAEAISVKKQHYNLLKERGEQIKNRLKTVDAVLNNTNVNQAQIDKTTENIYALERLKNERNTIQSISAVAQSNGSQQKNGKTLPIILFVLFALFCAVATTVIFFNLTVGIVAYVISVLCLIFGVVFVLNYKKTPVNNELNSNEKRINELDVQIATLQNEINAFFVNFNVQVDNYLLALEKIKRSVEDKRQIAIEVDRLQQEISQYNNDPDLTVEISFNNETVLLREQLNKINNTYREKADELANVRTQITHYEDLVGKYTELQEEYDLRKENLENLEERQRLLNLTVEYLSIADVNLKTKYRAPLQESFDKYMQLLTDGKAKGSIDIDLNVTLDEDGLSVLPDFYSEGYKNIFEFCKRFSLIDVLFTKEKPFIILDDPFNNLDDKNLQLAISVMEKLASNYQIIYLVCHSSRAVSK